MTTKSSSCASTRDPTAVLISRDDRGRDEKKRGHLPAVARGFRIRLQYTRPYLSAEVFRNRTAPRYGAH